MPNYAKQRIALRYWLLGAGFTQAADAMNYAEGFHKGVRKDNVTPEFAHQVAIASYLRTLLPHVRFPQETLCVAFLHDVREDYDVDDAEIRARYGPVVADAVDAMTKEFRGIKRDEAAVFQAIGADPVASVVKPADRINNQQTMIGVFTPVKVVSYTDETQRLFLPMLKRARRTFPDQEPAYENASLMLASQLELLAAIYPASS